MLTTDPCPTRARTDERTLLAAFCRAVSSLPRHPRPWIRRAARFPLAPLLRQTLSANIMLAASMIRDCDRDPFCPKNSLGLDTLMIGE